MDLLLREEAGKAQDIVEIFSLIRNNDPDHEQDITLAISGLNALSWALRELDKQIDAVHGRLIKTFADDLKLLQDSVGFTLQDVWNILGRLPRVAIAVDYQDAWKEVSRYCRGMGKQRLELRLRTYKLFTESLSKVLQRQSFSRNQYNDLRHDIRELRSLQHEDRRLLKATEEFGRLELVPVQHELRKPKSHERPRPEPARAMSPTASNASYETRQSAPSPPPLASLSPASPVSPITTFSTLSHASSVDPETKHWATKIFNNLPCTPLPGDPDQSHCFGDVDGKKHRGPAPAEYQRVLQLKFPGDLRTKFYWRARDFRTKIVCQWYDDRKNARLSCFPLADLHVKRQGPSLFLCTPTVRAASTCWASFSFTSYEWLVVFHCTVLSLRSHEINSRFDKLDHDLDGEDLKFAGVIRDSGYKHALRIIRDKSTNGIRLEASALDKGMKDTPIWTAFITHKITSPTWFRWTKNSCTVYLAELQRHVFTSEYLPHVRANGEHLLDFESVSDAEDFVKTIRGLREYIQAPRTTK